MALMGFFVFSPAQQLGWASTTPTTPALEIQLPSYEVTMTGYNAVPEQTDSDPFTTASGAYSNPELVAARSVDLKDELPFGTVIAIVPNEPTSNCGLAHVEESVGLRVIADVMHPRMHNKIDLLFATNDYVKVGGTTRNAARALGFCRNVQIVVVGKIDVRKMPKTQDQLVRMMDKELLAMNK
ncbi:MAG TPA: hypothetical protein VI483_02145 [Candidatus Paceibacterota bacterium]